MLGAKDLLWMLLMDGKVVDEFDEQSHPARTLRWMNGLEDLKLATETLIPVF